MITFILICVALFVFVIILFNFQKIVGLFKKIKLKPKKQKTEPKKEVVEEQPKSKLNYTEEDFTTVKVDSLNHEEEPEEEKEEQKSNKGGRLKGDIPSVTGQEVEVEDLGEYDENAGFDDDIDDANNNENFMNYDFEESESLSDEIKNLSPELKAILLSNILNKKDDE